MVYFNMLAELAPPHVQSAWVSRRERVRAAGLAACCNYFSKKKKKVSSIIKNKKKKKQKNYLNI